MGREPSVADALERTYEAGQSLIVRRVDLLVAETRLFLREARQLGVGALLAIAGWLFLVQGVIDGLAERYPRFAVELAVGLAHVAAAAALFFRTRGGPAKQEEP
jgi:hypothetical protein